MTKPKPKTKRVRYQKIWSRRNIPRAWGLWHEIEAQVIGDFAVPRNESCVVYIPSGMALGPTDCGDRKQALAFAQALHDARWWVGVDEFSQIIPETTEGKRDLALALWRKVLRGGKDV